MMGRNTYEKTEVVVTGIGLFTPAGFDKEKIWQNLLDGKNFIDRITRFNPEGFRSQIAAEIKYFNPLEYYSIKDVNRTDRATQLGLLAALSAVQDAGISIPVPDEISYHCGVIAGTGIGGLESFQKEYRDFLLGNNKGKKGPGTFTATLIPKYIPDATAGQFAIKSGIKGMNFCLSTACASSADAVGTAYRIISANELCHEDDQINMMVAGGFDAVIIESATDGFGNMRALSTRNDDPQRACRPFDRDRDGFVLAEGAGFLVLEDKEFAKKRGARIYAEIIGYGATADAYNIVLPDPSMSGAIRAMQMALRDAGIDPEQIDYINAHGTSTPVNDKGETFAIKTVFGDRAKKIPVNSTKSMIGHPLGAAGGIELIITILSILKQKVHPTINYEFPDPDCDLDYVPNIAREVEIEYAMSNSFGFNGHNAVLIVKK